MLSAAASSPLITGLIDELEAVKEITPENYGSILIRLSKRVDLSGRNLYMPMPAALTAKIGGPELEKVFILLGKEKALQRAGSARQRME